MRTAVKERPILFNAPMVRAVIDGSKTQTRRIMKPQPTLCADGKGHQWPSSVFQTMVDVEGPTGFQGVGCEGMPADASPYGSHRDRLWVREAVADIGPRLTYRADVDDGAHCKVKKWTPSIHMPRWASRILLEIVNVRVERLNNISEVDAIAEGIIENEGMRPTDPRLQRFWRDYRLSGDGTFCVRDPIASYRSLWESINGPGSWGTNPWVWVVEFKRVDHASPPEKQAALAA